MFIDIHFREFCGPKVPLFFPHDEAGIGESRFTLAKGVPADVIWMSMREDDRVNVSRRNPLDMQILKQSSCILAETTCTRIHQHPILTGIYHRTDVRTYPLRPLLRLEVVFAEHMLKAFPWRVGEEKGSRIWEGGGFVCEGAIADGCALESS